jgi:hypothetical protein
MSRDFALLIAEAQQREGAEQVLRASTLNLDAEPHRTRVQFLRSLPDKVLGAHKVTEQHGAAGH